MLKTQRMLQLKRWRKPDRQLTRTEADSEGAPRTTRRGLLARLGLISIANSIGEPHAPNPDVARIYDQGEEASV
jgi:hypothetical protein